MKVTVIDKETKKVYWTARYAVKIETRENTTNREETEIVIKAGGHGYAFNTKYYDVVVEIAD